MDTTNEKFVSFSHWCKKCKHFNVEETDDQCNECLTYPVNLNSKKPVRFEDKDE